MADSTPKRKADALQETGDTFLNTDVARVVGAPAHIVWKEICDFIEQTHHFGIRPFTTNPNPNVGGDVVGCKRHITRTGLDPVEEILVDYNSQAMCFSLTLTPCPKAPFLGYRGTISISPLGAERKESLLRYHGSMDGLLESGHEFTKQSACTLLAESYEGFFASVARAVESPRGRLAGKICLVTGGASGLGEAISKAFADEGATVVIADRDEKSAMDAITGHGRGECQIEGASFMKLDVSDPLAVDALMRSLSVKHGRVDVVVNNAGITGLRASTAEYPTADWERVRSINLDGAFFVLRAALKQMQDQTPSGGVVLNMSSITGLNGFGCIPGYTAAKSALVALTKSTAVEYAGVGVRVVGIAPTAVSTPLVAEMERQKVARGEALSTRHMNPIPGRPVPKDVANAAVFLCSDEAKWVTGCVLPVDGGYLAGNTEGATERGALKACPVGQLGA